MAAEPARLDLFWIPLGAGGQVVRRCGGAYERIVAARQHRRPLGLLHAALVARSASSPDVVVEVAPEADARGGQGAVAGGAVGLAVLGRSRWFRYEVRRWEGGVIPDLAEAVASPVTVTDAAAEVEAVLEALSAVPTPVWGRDELRTGEMWNSNSVVSWVLARCGLLGRVGGPPPGWRAPGWDAGAVVARRAGPHSPAGGPSSDPARRRGAET